MKRSILKQLIKEQILNILKEEGTGSGGGQAAGNMELDKITLPEAEAYLKKIGLNIPDFPKHLAMAKKLTALGRTQRKDMPVINDDDVKEFQTRLKKGNLDIHKPFSKNTNEADPFPHGLSGFDAEEFLTNGLKDGSKNDDVIGVTIKQIAVKDLKPIQKQIYFDKSMNACAKDGIEKSKQWLSSKTFFITSSDNFIIDGHHRWMSGMLISPDIQVNCLSVDLSISKLLPMAIAYGDAIGNKRNQ